MLTIVVPIYNEAPHLLPFLVRLDGVELKIPKQIIFVDDASLDASLSILKNFSFQTPVKIIENPINRGKGYAIRLALQKVETPLVLIQDADMEYNPNEINFLIGAMRADMPYAVFGSRYLKGRNPNESRIHFFANFFLTFIFNFVYRTRLTDMETCYKLVRHADLQRICLTRDDFGIEPEISAKLTRSGVKILEVPISYRARNIADGKKIRWWDGIIALWLIFYFRYKSFRIAKP